MSDDNFVMVSLEDGVSRNLSDVLGNKTCKKIIKFLLKKDSASAKDIFEELGISMSLIDYDIKKLLKAGLVEKDKEFFWSEKGKKIVMYKVSNKSIVISPRKEIGSKLKSLIPAVLLASASTFAVYAYEKINGVGNLVQRSADIVTPSLANSFYEVGASDEMAKMISPEIIPQTHLWVWFLFGAVLMLVIFSILNWRKL